MSSSDFSPAHSQPHPLNRDIPRPRDVRSRLLLARLGKQVVGLRAAAARLDDPIDRLRQLGQNRRAG